MHGDVLFESAAGRLVLSQELLGGGDVLSRGFEPRLERLLVLGLLGQPAPGGIGGAIEPLQGDQSFQVGVHGLFEQKKGPAGAEPEFYMFGVGPPSPTRVRTRLAKRSSRWPARRRLANRRSRGDS